MARVTVEDCTKIVENRFELVVLASKRGRDIYSGSPLLVSKDNDKNAVIALREIASGRINIEELRRILIQMIQKGDNTQLIEQAEEVKKEAYLVKNSDSFLEEDYDINEENLADFSMVMQGMKGHGQHIFSDDDVDVED